MLTIVKNFSQHFKITQNKNYNFVLDFFCPIIYNIYYLKEVIYHYI